MKRRAVLYDLGNGVTCIDDAGNSVCYVVCGEKKAAVIDTVNGMENLHDVVREVTNLPLVVINTHGHCDHIFGNVFFEEAYIHPADVELHDEHFAMKAKTTMEDAARFGATKEDYDFYMSGKPCKLNPISEGEVIDLGGRTLTVLLVAGHTPGSIALWDDKTGILFSGDAINGQEWMQLDESTKLATYLDSLRALDAWKGKITELRNGHNTYAVPTGYIDEMAQAVSDILAANGAGDEDFDGWFGPACKRHFLPVTEGWVLYTNDKL